MFERQVDSDNARLQKGEITLTDLAQSESSLAGARAVDLESSWESVFGMSPYLVRIALSKIETSGYDSDYLTPKSEQ